MEQEKRKKMVLFIGAMVVGVMFVTSYAAFGNNGSTPTSSTTIAQSTYPVFGSANAVITGYGSSLSVTLVNQSASNALNSTLSALESNGTITNFIPTSNGFIVYAQGSAPYTVQQSFQSSLPPNSIALNGSESVSIPKKMVLYYRGTAINVYANITNFSVYVHMLKPTGANISVNVQALVLPDGDVYNNNIQVT